ncbi:amidohydrolase family protein [Panacibacter ginsenosidivorans]|uniref:Amidohydrolase family protein n=1 Tax=Panacibacter ginsenosidivorans TaxID=1813871 RepID=A0A5B8VDI8_9BACT|nr:amidohydrolase family protein [Panacibacter ginsenosidivorans]QEC69382.1 amidohydrolase family protein [Panacibacter ginsenosidivorans]
MQRIDAHQHFWLFDKDRHAWINDAMHVIQKDFMPADLQPILQQNNIDGCVLVQVDQTEEENIFQLNNAVQFDFIKGVVGWVDLQADNIEERLRYYQQFNKMKGFRHILQGEEDRALMVKPAFKHGISLLNKYNYAYDILIFPDQLKYAYELVKAFPDQRFVIDHIAKPYIKDKKIDEWKKDISLFNNCANVYCKISGMVTEADWKQWKKEDFAPYLDAVVETFDTDRIMFGSDWPVCLVAASYEKMLGLVQNYFAFFSKDEQDAFFGGNAIQFYNL